MARIPTKLAEELRIKKKVVESYFKPEDIGALVKNQDSKYSYSGVYCILFTRMFSMVREVEGEK